MEFTAKEIAEILGGTVEGDPQAKVTTFARIESGKSGARTLWYLTEDKRYSLHNSNSPRKYSR